MTYRLLLFFLCCHFVIKANAQVQWKLIRNEGGIKVFTGISPQSKYKSVRVTCTLDGNYDRLINVLTNVEQHTEWVYKTKESKLLKVNSPTDVYYYTETTMPWPMENRDAVIRLVVNKEQLPHALIIHARSEPLFLEKKSGKVRIPYSSGYWMVKMNDGRKLEIDYIFEVNPGGSIPAWVVNLFADKGPYESFKKLGAILKQ